MRDRTQFPSICPALLHGLLGSSIRPLSRLALATSMKSSLTLGGHGDGVDRNRSCTDAILNRYLPLHHPRLQEIKYNMHTICIAICVYCICLLVLKYGLDNIKLCALFYCTQRSRQCTKIIFKETKKSKSNGTESMKRCVCMCVWMCVCVCMCM